MSCGAHAVHSRLLSAAAAALALLSAGCSQIGETGSLSSLTGKQPEPKPFFGQTEEHKTAETAGQKFGANPRELQASLDYARSLKALGNKQAALGILQQASQYHADNRELASEYGRLALEFDQLALAEKLLAKADDPARPDWRVLSARGTVLAKQGNYDGAIPFYERALTFDPGNPSVTNNLAMAVAAVGDAPRAETLLRQATATRPDDARIRTNLTILAELQGRREPAAGSPVAATATVVQPAPVRPAATTTPRSEPRPVPAPNQAPAPAPVAARPSIAPWQTSTAAQPAPVVTEAPAPVPAPRAAIAPWQTSALAAPQPPAPAAVAAVTTQSQPVAVMVEPRRVAPAVAGWSMEVSATPQPTDPAPARAAEPATVDAEPLPSGYWRRTK